MHQLSPINYKILMDYLGTIDQLFKACLSHALDRLYDRFPLIRVNKPGVLQTRK